MKKYFGEWYFSDIIAHIDYFELGTKIKSEKGNVYILRQTEGEGKQRKFSRCNGTKLRFMTYENIGKKFEILEDNTEEIEKIGKSFEQIGYDVGKITMEIAKGFEKAINTLRKDKDNEL